MKKIVLGLSALCLLMACGSSEQPAVTNKGFRRNIDA